MTDHRYGPGTERIAFVRDEQIPAMTAERFRLIAEAARDVRAETRDAEERALAAARSVYGREEETVVASEDLRRAIWGIIWDSSWADAWILSWVAARVGLGLATEDLVGQGVYSVEDYMALVGPWTHGYHDMPLPEAVRG